MTKRELKQRFKKQFSGLSPNLESIIIDIYVEITIEYAKAKLKEQRERYFKRLRTMTKEKFDIPI